MGCGGLDKRRTGTRVAVRPCSARRELLCDTGFEQDGILAVHLEHAARRTETPHRREQRGGREAEVVDHERLRGRHPTVHDRRQFGDRVFHQAGDHWAERVVDRRIGLGRRTPFPHSGQH